MTYKIYFPLILLTFFGIVTTMLGLYVFMDDLFLSYVVIIVMDVFLVFLLVYLLNKIVKKPVFKLLEGLRKINNEIKNGKTPVEVYKTSKLKYEYHDEIGVISVTINSLLRLMAHTFVKYQTSQKDTQEYLKAIYAGGLVSIGDIKGDIIYVNDELCNVTGYTRDELIGKPHSIFRDQTTSPKVYEEMWNTIQSGHIYKKVLQNRKKDGTTFYVNTTIIPIINEKNEIVKYISYRDDISELISSKQKLKKTYTTDKLTNLGNRLKMLNDISDDNYLAIIDINFFREINDFYGYKIGDVILKEIANKLHNFFCVYDMEVYHLNADEFSILLQAKTYLR